MARKGKKQEKDVETVAENDAGSSKNDVDANPDSTTEDAPKKGNKRGSTAKEEIPAKKKKGGVAENGISKSSARPKRATASKAEQEVKALLVAKKKPGAKKGAAKKPATPRKEPAQFEVESIVSSRKRKGRLEYKIRWKGYSHSSDTWEPARNLNCPEILDSKWRTDFPGAPPLMAQQLVAPNGGQWFPKRNKFGKNGLKTLKFVPSCYYRVEIHYGNRYGKDYLLKVIASHIKPTPLIPLQCKNAAQDFHFAVEDHSAAEKILQATGQISLNDGWKLRVVVRPFTPVVEIDDKLTAAMKVALGRRFNAANNALDLTHFQSDDTFTAEELICPLNRPNVMSYVIELIAESVPNLTALNLSKNRISAIDHLKVLIDKLPNLKILHIADNMIRDLKQFDSLKGLKLEEINLDGNTLASQFTDKEVYIREVRKRFPKVIKLDNTDLPKPITFDLEDVEEGNIPKSQMSFMCDAEQGALMARTFIEQYYQIFDSGDRTNLAAAYHDHAQFSMMSHVTANDGHACFSLYQQDSRNLLKVVNPERRLRLLRVGKPSIIETLKSFPETEHDPSTFVVDLVFFTPELIQLVVGGLYREKERPATGSPIKYFSRDFVIVPVGTGFCIVNETLCIHYPTAAQIKLMKSKSKEVAPVPGPSTASPLVSPPVANDVVAADVLLARQQLVAELAAKSGMNIMWSEKCLVETNWNPEQAMYAFMQLQEAGKIPLEAFQK